MKIGIDARFYNPEASGLGRYSCELLVRLLNLGEALKHQFVVYLKSDIKSIKGIDSPNVKFISTDVKHYSLQEQTKFNRILSEEKFDIVHFLNFNHPMLYAGKKLFTIHDIILTFYPGKNMSPFRKWAYEAIVRHALYSADRIIAVSHYTKRQLVEHYHTDETKIDVIYEAVDKRYQRVKDKKIIDKVKEKYHIDKPYIIYVGNLRTHKNLVRLVEAFCSIFTRNRNLQLVLVGKPDRKYPDIAEAVVRHHLQKAVIMPGFVPEDDLPALFSGAELATLPSLLEGFGLPPLEAMSCGCPFVSSNSSCLPEVAGDGALYYDPFSIVDIADKITKVLKDESIRKVLVEAGRKRVQEFSWDKTAEETLALYESMGSKTAANDAAQLPTPPETPPSKVE